MLRFTSLLAMGRFNVRAGDTVEMTTCHRKSVSSCTNPWSLQMLVGDDSATPVLGKLLASHLMIAGGLDLNGYFSWSLGGELVMQSWFSKPFFFPPG